MPGISEALRGIKYPGRGIILGKSADSRAVVVAYFLTGRSENSKNRVLEADGRGIRTSIFDESREVDPSLIIYAPVRICGNMMIVTNGRQTDTVCEYIRNGDSYDEALREWSFEPDAPIYTPRISGVIDLADGAYRLSLIKADGANCLRFFFEYGASGASGRLIHTYAGDVDPPGPFCGEPVPVDIPADIDEFTDAVWGSLDETYRVSLFTRYIDLKTKNHETRIINSNRREP